MSVSRHIGSWELKQSWVVLLPPGRCELLGQTTDWTYHNFHSSQKIGFSRNFTEQLQVLGRPMSSGAFGVFFGNALFLLANENKYRQTSNRYVDFLGKLEVKRHQFPKFPHIKALTYNIWFCTGPNIGLGSCSTPLLRPTCGRQRERSPPFRDTDDHTFSRLFVRNSFQGIKLQPSTSGSGLASPGQGDDTVSSECMQAFQLSSN